MKNKIYIEENKIKTRVTSYKGKRILDTSLYRKYEGLRVEKWILILR